ncbi:hypothetical protein G7085_16650 [Tessaracoccus sp. HDW20]|nr:hypothetical protein [Tessaracoccus coleopterorum]
MDKTANLIADLGHGDGEPIDITLAGSHPGHWVTLVWIAAAWQRGCPVYSTATGSELLVVGPDDERRSDITVACSLHPLGRGFTTAPVGAIDYVEVFGQPDVHDVAGWAQQDIFDGVALPGSVPPRDTRLLLPIPVPGLETVLEALVAPVLGEGSTVVAVNCPDELLIQVATAEHALLR